MSKLTIEEMRKQSNRNKAKRTKKFKKHTESNSTPKRNRNRKKPTSKEDLKIAKLKEVFGMSEAEFKRLTGGKKPGDIKNTSGLGRPIKV